MKNKKIEVKEVLKIINDERLRHKNFSNRKPYSFFYTKSDKRWFDGMDFALQELEALIDSKL
jgi:hypothetical protein